jgi:threonyl-tRNA synthetase
MRRTRVILNGYTEKEGLLFFGILIEHFGGAFPTWLAPVQAQIIPVSLQAHQQYTKELEEKLKDAGIRVELDLREEKLGYKIREAQVQKIPYVLVIGDKEACRAAVNVRKYGQDTSEELLADEFIRRIRLQIKNKALPLKGPLDPLTP